jgi:hypothetical protein
MQNQYSGYPGKRSICQMAPMCGGAKKENSEDPALSCTLSWFYICFDKVRFVVIIASFLSPSEFHVRVQHAEDYVPCMFVKNTFRHSAVLKNYVLSTAQKKWSLWQLCVMS